jgi:L-iditol 2-dehydrogenase
MRAQVFHGPGDLRFEDIPVPEPEQGGLVMRVEAALTCGTDVKTLRRGHPVMVPHVPTVFGHELAGVVTAVGRGAPGVKEGDRVVAANSAPCGGCRLCAAGRPNLCEDLLFVNGAYGEYIALPPRLVARNVVPIGPGLAASSAAFAEPLACALLAVERGRVEAGMTVAIWGHGPLGCLLALAAGQRGAQAVIVGKAGWRLDQVRGLGLGTCVDALSVPDMAAHLRGLTGGRGPDVTVDATGRPEVWEQAIDGVGRGGTVVLFGGCALGTSVRVDTRRAHYEELTLVGAFHHTPTTIRRAVDLLESKAIDPVGLLTHRVGLGQVKEALALMERGETMKVLVDPWQ